ncbi:hypothetical protein GGR57DRAFT_508245 [Xylariaceae sp. FL1272]|nr:hypothetical protein GGR57DRAFT_508245 [Xylariaceae sp. FL1272]
MFDLSKEEKHETLLKINTLLQRTMLLIQCARDHRSKHDFAEALALVTEALTLANDPDACDPELAPLSTCNLYKGHILLALNNYSDAYDAYTAAATARTSALTETPAAKQAAKRALRLRDKVEEAKRKPSVHTRGSSYSIGGRTIEMQWDGKLGKFTLPHYMADVALPVTVRPGPVRRRPFFVSQSHRVHLERMQEVEVIN